MRITRKREPVIFDYKSIGHKLESAWHYPYLGVEPSSTLDWSHHIDNKVNKANKTLVFLRRNLSNYPESIKELAYKALVGPHLEYASPVWDLWMDKHIKQIEAVQWRSARFVKSCWERTPGTVTNLRSDLDWPSLQYRRKIARITLFHKAVHGESALEFSSYIKRRNRRLRSSHNDRFIEMKPKTDAYRNSFYCKTIKEWNSLPSNVF